jgi:DNA-binding NarL/FixJ family response regulator
VTGAEAIEARQHNIPDIIVMDIGLPDMNGIEATQVILRHSPSLKVVALSIYDDDQTVVNASRLQQANHFGYLPDPWQQSDIRYFRESTGRSSIETYSVSLKITS